MFKALVLHRKKWSASRLRAVHKHSVTRRFNLFNLAEILLNVQLVITFIKGLYLKQKKNTNKITKKLLGLMTSSFAFQASTRILTATALVRIDLKPPSDMVSEMCSLGHRMRRLRVDGASVFGGRTEILNDHRHESEYEGSPHV